ncbi:class I SAM-dependent methyltransferase [Marinicella sp. W31]|uniref:class I SAM-dependent methyltransferase n=1 Tax=Marinicella sp. W31 TaxID=3023713 RepID=UPI003756D893
MMKKTGILLLLLLLTACHSHRTKNTEISRQDRLNAINAAVNDDTRIETDRIRDSGRKPVEILDFSGIKPGDKIVEIAPGSGYYTAILSRLVGDQGVIYGIDPARIFEVFPVARDGFKKYMQADPRNNVEYSAQNLDAIKIPNGLDQVWMILYYHDTIWTNENRMAMNKAFFDALKPGGIYLVVDHHALPGADDSVTQNLHRMDASIAKSDIEAAGFVLDAESPILANPQDPKNDSVFKPERRGKTDRFVWRFIKPVQ